MRSLRRFCACLLAFSLLLALCAQAAAEEDGGETARDMTPLPEDWFDDAVFVGDSISITLEKQCLMHGGLGEAQFLCEYSYGVFNALSGDVKLWYQGGRRMLWDALPLTGAGKIFLMLGVNDIARYGGIDRTMEMWAAVFDRVHEACPEVQWYIESMLPIWCEAEYYALNNPKILAYNERLKAFCEENGCVFVDIADYFRDESGGLSARYCSDFYVHVSFAAAEMWVGLLKDPANYSQDPRSFSDKA